MSVPSRISVRWAKQIYTFYNVSLKGMAIIFLKRYFKGCCDCESNEEVILLSMCMYVCIYVHVCNVCRSLVL